MPRQTSTYPFHFLLSFLACCGAVTQGLALPRLEEPVPLDKEFSEIITIYPDSGNTPEKQSFWLVPSTARIVKDPNGRLAYGLVHSGISSFDPDGVNAQLTVTFQPYIDQATLKKAQDVIDKVARDRGAKEVTFRFVTPIETTCRILIGGQYIDWDGKVKSVVKGGTVEAGIPFQVKVTNNFDVRALSQAGGPEAATFGAVYTMKYQGVGDRVHFKVIAKFEQSLDHFKAQVKGSGWFGLVKGNASAEWEKFRDSGAVKLEVISGTEAQVDKYMKALGAEMLMNKLMENLANRTGMFARTIQSKPLPDAEGGGGLFGWGVSVGGGFRHVEDKSDITIEMDLQFTREHEIVFGMNFPSGGKTLEPFTKNLTDTNIPFPTSDMYKKRQEQEAKCIDNSLTKLKMLLDQKKITESLWEKKVEEALEKGCYFKLSGVPR